MGFPFTLKTNSSELSFEAVNNSFIGALAISLANFISPNFSSMASKLFASGHTSNGAKLPLGDTFKGISNW